MSQFRITDVVKRGPAGLSDIARTIALPKDHYPKRLPTFPAACRTAVTSQEFLGTITLAATTATTAALTRYPSAPLFLPRSFPLGIAAFSVGALYYSAVRLDATQASAMDWSGTTFGHFFSYEGQVYAAAPFGSSAYIRVNGTGGVELEFIRFDPEDNGSMRTITYPYTPAAASTYELLPSEIGRFTGVRIANVTGLAESVMLHFSTSTAQMWPVPVPVLQDLPIVYSETRCNSSATLFSNVSKVMDKEGTVRGARLFTAMSGSTQSTEPTSVNDAPSPYFFTMDHINNVHPSDRYSGAMEHGIYTYTLPHQNSDEFKDWGMRIGVLSSDTATLTGQTTVPLLHNMCGEPFSAIYFQDITQTSTNLAYMVNYHLEFKTNVPVFDLGFSAIPLEAYHAAQLSLLANGVFYQNAEHWKDVSSSIQRGLSSSLALVAPQYGSPKQQSRAKPRKGRRPPTTGGNMTQVGFVNPGPPRRRQARKSRKQKTVRVRSRTPVRRPKR